MIQQLQREDAELRQKTATPNRFAWRLSCATVGVLGFLLTWFCGHRGLYSVDQSMIFDGAWRLLQGQVPYRDVFFPFGPVTFVIQAGFFKVFGVSFSNMVLPAAIMDALAGVITIRIVRQLLPEQRMCALLGGLVTACWFQAPFGTLWLEQTAFFFGLLALWATIESEWGAHRYSAWLQPAAGLSIALAILSKQNAGILLYPVVAGVTVASHLRDWIMVLRRLAAQAGGLAFGLCSFAAWLWLFSSPKQYFHYSIEVTRSLAAQRAPHLLNTLDTILTLELIPLHLRWCALIFALVGLGAILAGLIKHAESIGQAKPYLIIGWIIVASLEFQQLFIMVTENEGENGLPFLGLAGGLAMGLVTRWLWQKDVKLLLSSASESFQAALPHRSGSLLVFVTSTVLFAVSIGHGARVSWKRYVQQFTDESRFNGSIHVDGLRGLKWADAGFPVEFSSKVVRRADFEELNDWIASHPGNFFVFPDSSILYGLHGRPSPQPWLYLREGHSYVKSDAAYVDDTVVASLQRNRVRAVILEQAFWSPPGALLRLPKLRSWIYDNFKKEKEIGIFEVWTANSN